MRKIFFVCIFIFVFSNSFAVTNCKHIDINTEYVILNVETLIYHDESCQFAKKCTKNCKRVKRSEVGTARPCKICGKSIK